MTALRTEDENTLLLKRLKSSIGLAWRDSKMIKATRKINEKRRIPKIDGEVQPQAWPWFNPNNNNTNPDMKSSAPARSKRSGFSEGGSMGIKRQLSRKASRPTGTLI